MRSRLLIAITAILILAAAPATAHANVLNRLYAPLHLHPKVAPSPSFIRAESNSTISALSAELGLCLWSGGGISPELIRSITSSH